jgi:hypothetical protein
MIIVTRLHGASVAVNCDLIERLPRLGVLLAGRLEGSQATGQHLYLVPTPDPDS